MAEIDGLPLGLSILGRQGADTTLLEIASRLSLSPSFSGRGSG
jgi:Asp-tRNA(Asn)/Glu-tRNA(Gln) amidotransferase A subunit family amidase